MSEHIDLSYSLEASANRYYFYQGLNDINIFIEDTGKEYEYEIIFKRLFKDVYSIKTIFALGGKLEVKKKFTELGDLDIKTNTKNFFIVDGDFDRYINKNDMIKHKNFIYLESYNIENYFLDEYACILYMECQLKCIHDIAKNKINYSFWKKTITTQAKKLFICYCYIQKYFPQIPTTGRNNYEFIDANTGFEKNDSSYESIYKKIIELDKNAPKLLKNIENSYISMKQDDFFDFICGKFLFDSLYCYLKKISKRNFDKNNFRFFLINHFDIDKLNYLKLAILEK